MTDFFAKQLSSPGNRITDDDTLDNAFIEVDRVLGTTYMWSHHDRLHVHEPIDEIGLSLGNGDPEVNAYGILMLLRAGEISRGEFVRKMATWDFAPTHKVRNEIDAVVQAYDEDLIDDDDFDLIANATARNQD